MKRIYIFLILNLLLQTFSLSYAQSVLDDISEDDESEALAPDLAQEKIIKQSGSRKIFIISNDNQSFDKGDFITIIINNKLATRAIVAKSVDKQAGIKIVKIYSLNLYNKLVRGREVQVLRGDDSYFRNRKKKSEKPDEVKISEEDDLYNDTTLLDDNISFDENKKRAIKTDNLITLAFSQVEGLNSDGGSQRYSQLNAMWAYQVADNIWAEALYGQNTINDFPSAGLNTKMTNLVIRAKYTFSAPFHSYLKPYIGYQIIGASGDLDEANATSQAQINADASLQEDLKKNSLVFGVTGLKRLVPGWFIRVDLGTDLLGLGFSLEF